MRHAPAPLPTRALLASALAVLLGAALLAAVPAAADTGAAPAARPAMDYTAQADQLSPAAYPETITEAVMIPGKDGIGIYTEITRPDPQAYPDLGPLPVILEASVYHGTLADRLGTRVFPDPVDEDGNPIGLVGHFAPRGYAVAMMSLRGTGRSEGCLDHLGPDDAEDMRLVIEHLAGEEWSSGRVGMIGHSYVAATQNVAAAMNPEGLVTIVPSAGLASMYDHQFQMGVPYNLQYIGPMAAYEALALQRHLPPGLTSPLGGPTGDDFGGNVQYTGCGLPQSAALAGTGQVTGQYELWHAVRDWRAKARNSDVRVFMVHGVNDNAARVPAAEWFLGGRYDRAGDKLWLGQWDHGSAANTRCRTAAGDAVGHPTCRFGQWQDAVHAWFDATLLQTGVDTGPAVEVFLNGRQAGQAGEVWTATSWAQPALTRLYLDASDGSLRTTPPTADASVAVQRAQVSGPLSSGADGAVFTMTAEEDLLLVGLPELRLRASSLNPGVQHLVVEIARIPADGSAEEPIAYCAIQPQLRSGVATINPVVPGQVMDLAPQCFTMAHQVFAGDQIVLTVGSRTPHHVAAGVDPQLTVFTGPTQPSAIRVPLQREGAFTTSPDPLVLPG